MGVDIGIDQSWSVLAFGMYGDYFVRTMLRTFKMSEEVLLLVVYTFSAKSKNMGCRDDAFVRDGSGLWLWLSHISRRVYSSDFKRVGRVYDRIIDVGLDQWGVLGGGAGARLPYSSLQVGWRTPARPFNILTHPCIVEGLSVPWYV